MSVLKNQLRGIFALAAGTSLAIGAITGLCFYQLTNTVGNIDHTYQVVIKAKRVLGLLVDVSAGQRGYQLTKNKEFLETYRVSRPLVPLELKELVRITSDNPFQTEKLSKLSLLVTDRLLAVDTVIEKDLSTEEQKSYLLKSKNNLDEIRKIIDEVTREEYSLLNTRKDRLGLLLLVSGTSIFALLLCELFILIFSQYITDNEVKNKEELQIRLIEAYKLLGASAEDVYNKTEKYLNKNQKDEDIIEDLRNELKVLKKELNKINISIP